MREVIIERYGEGPPTHNWGSTTIDGIFATEGINITQGGYGGFDLSPTDHLSMDRCDRKRFSRSSQRRSATSCSEKGNVEDSISKK